MTRRLDWVGIGAGADVEQLRRDLGPRVDQRFGTRSMSGIPLPWEAASGAFPADALLDALIDRHDQQGGAATDWILGITTLDLFAPGRPFVFGEATIGGCCALISLARLGDRAEQLHPRIFTTVAHELAHVAGLDHCDDPRCVMWASTTVEDTDRKGDAFCAACAVRFSRTRFAARS